LIEQDATRRFIEAWKRAEKGEHVAERHLAFESKEAFARALTSEQSDLPI